MSVADAIPVIGDGHYATLLTDEEQAKDDLGFTNPNLHRRVDPQDPEDGSDEYKARDYRLNIYGIYSYRSTEAFIHNEDESDDNDEIP